MVCLRGQQPREVCRPDGGGTNIIKGDEDFKQKTQEALDTIKSKPKGNELVSKLEDSDKKHVITGTDDHNKIRPDADYEYGEGSGSTIYFDPDKKEGGMNEEGSRERPPFIGLAHELGHAEAIDEGTQSFDRGSKKSGTTPPSEKNSMERENQIREEHGLPLRPSYYE